MVGYVLTAEALRFRKGREGLVWSGGVWNKVAY